MFPTLHETSKKNHPFERSVVCVCVFAFLFDWLFIFYADQINLKIKLSCYTHFTVKAPWFLEKFTPFYSFIYEGFLCNLLQFVFIISTCTDMPTLPLWIIYNNYKVVKKFGFSTGSPSNEANYEPTTNVIVKIRKRGNLQMVILDRSFLLPMLHQRYWKAEIVIEIQL